MLNSLRHVVGAVVFLVIWAGLALAFGVVMDFDFPPLGPNFVLGGIDVDWRFLPGAVLGFLCGVYCWRASLRWWKRKRLRSKPKIPVPISRLDRWSGFLTGVAWTAAVAIVLSLNTQCAFPLAFAAVLGGFLVCGGLGLWWLTLWARQKNGRLGQFGVGSLLFLMVYAAIFFGTVRWIVVRASTQWRGADSVGLFCVVALICLLVALISVRFVLGMSEAVLWAAVWLVNRPQVRRWIRGWRKNDRS